jgi:hypothetical protein
VLGGGSNVSKAGRDGCDSGEIACPIAARRQGPGTQAQRIGDPG